MVVTANQVKELRERSGAGIMECKRALEQVEGDIARAIDLLKQQGLAKADKKTGRAASSPSYVSIDEVPATEWADLEKEHGDRNQAATAVVLLEQPFIKDPKLT